METTKTQSEGSGGIETASIQSLQTSKLAWGLAGLQIVAALVLAFSGLQLLSTIQFYVEWMRSIPYLMMACAVWLVLGSVWVAKQRYPWVIVNMVADFKIFFLFTAFTGWAMSHGMFSPLHAMGVIALFFASILSPVTLPAAKRASKARAQLHAEGIEVGF